jgi:hypothetical protein
LTVSGSVTSLPEDLPAQGVVALLPGTAGDPDDRGDFMLRHLINEPELEHLLAVA